MTHEPAAPRPDGAADPSSPAPDGPPAEAPAPRAKDPRLSLALAIMLAALGLMGALVAWRVGSSAGNAAGATQEGLTVARARAAAEATAEGLVSQTSEAWLAYESERRRAESLRADGFADAALEAAERASAHWFLVRPEFLDPAGTYDPGAHRAALMAEAETRQDLDPAPHFALAAAEEARVRHLLLVGILVAAALPLLTLAEVSRGRLRLAASAVGSVVFAAGTIAMVASWL